VGTPLDRYRDDAPLVLRLFLGTFLVYMAQDNVFSSARMDEFELFLGQHGFPLPGLAARISVYAQFTAGILVLLGLLTRLAAAVMVVNFVVAVVGVHLGMPFRTFLEPLAMLSCSAFLAIAGAGRLSLDRIIGRG
jgi:putative oxidoreductase